MKYKFKVDTPWGAKGEDAGGYNVGCEKYPDIFELAPGAEEIEIVAKFMREFPKQSTALDWYNKVAEHFIKCGLDPYQIKSKSLAF